MSPFLQSLTAFLCLAAANGENAQMSFLAAAKEALVAAQAEAVKIGSPSDIVVVDRFANLAAFERMDGAWIGSIDIAIKKAITARSFDMPSGAIGNLSQPGGPLFMIEVSNGGLISFCGGIPLKIGDEVVGAIGVSGGAVTQDCQVAEAGKARFEQLHPVVPQTIARDMVKDIMARALAATQLPGCKTNNKGGACLHDIAIVDAGGKLLEFSRMDGAWLGSVDIALKKAKTAVDFCSVGDTGKIGLLSQPGQSLWQIENSNAGLITFPGGLAIKNEAGECIGAIGASGGLVEADHFVASTALLKTHYEKLALPAKLAQAVQATSAAEKEATTLGIAEDISVTDAGGNLISFTRMTNAWAGSIDISIKKANSAVKFAMESGAIGGLSDPALKGSGPDSLYGIELTNGGLISFPGGVVVKDAQGEVQFGIGVSGSTVENDYKCASAGLKAFGEASPEKSVELTIAMAIIEAAASSIQKRGKPSSDLCVVDQFLDVVAFKRMDGAWRGSIDIACKKAKTAVMFNISSDILGSISHPKLGQAKMGSLYGIEHSNNFDYATDIVSANAYNSGSEPGGLVTFGGGLPLVVDGKLIGGFGVSGSIVPDDMHACRDGVAALHPKDVFV